MKRLRKLYLAVSLFMTTITAPLSAHEIDPRFPIAGKGVFGASGLYSREVVLPNQVGLNPATMNFLLDIKGSPQTELDWGELSLKDGLKVRIGIINYTRSLSRRATLRVSLYGISSNRSPVPLSAPLEVNHNGQSAEIVSAYRLNNNFDLGIALVPYDRINTRLSLSGIPVADGSARSLFEGRLGVLWHSGKTRTGFVWGREFDKTKAKLLENAKSISGHFAQNSLTGGISYDPRLGTTLFYSYQDFKLKGEASDVTLPISYWGINQFLTKNWFIRWVRSGPGQSVIIGYMGNDWEGYLSFVHRAFAQSESLYGKGDVAFFSVVRKL